MSNSTMSTKNNLDKLQKLIQISTNGTRHYNLLKKSQVRWIPLDDKGETTGTNQTLKLRIWRAIWARRELELHKRRRSSMHMQKVVETEQKSTGQCDANRRLSQQNPRLWSSGRSRANSLNHPSGTKMMNHWQMTLSHSQNRHTLRTKRS